MAERRVEASPGDPAGWSALHRRLSASKDAEVRERTLALSVLFGDPQAMASALVALLRKSPMRDELVAAGRARAPEFSPRHVAARYAALAEVWARN